MATAIGVRSIAFKKPLVCLVRHIRRGRYDSKILTQDFPASDNELEEPTVEARKLHRLRRYARGSGLESGV